MGLAIARHQGGDARLRGLWTGVNALMQLDPTYGYGYFVAFSRNFTSAARSSAEPMVCSGILVPGV